MRQRVIEAAATVLRRKGYSGLRTDEVSRVAKVSRGAQQHHFPTKDSLVLATAAYLLNDGLERGRKRAQSAQGNKDPIEAVIEDCMDFFLGPDFGVISTWCWPAPGPRAARRGLSVRPRKPPGVEAAWLEVLCAHGIPPAKAEKILWLTISIVRGFSVRALWQRDEKLFRALLDEWKVILYGHLNGLKGSTR